MSASSDLATPPLRVVGIGASAGGLQAIESLFDAMPADTGMAFVLVQHLSPDYKSLMDELLARHTAMEIIRVEGPTPIKPNTVFLIPPKSNLILVGSNLELVPQDFSAGANFPIDQFFNSLATEVREKAVAIVLSGTGSDGSRGVQSVRRAGGLVLVQSVETAAFDGMPRNAIATRVVDMVCSPEEMPERIAAYLEAPDEFVRDLDRDQFGPDSGTIDRVFRLFRQRYGIDFSLYKAGTIDRRLERRMQLANHTNLEAYLARIESDPAELAHLYRDLLVEVTRFFRDPHMYQRLASEVLPDIVRRASSKEVIRVWVPGCATGEEAYSIAMRFHSVIERMGSNAQVKVFATDVHQESLEVASVGVYSGQSMERVSDVDRQRYFRKHGTLYHVAPEIRRMVIFARHDLTRDPPFTRLDLISCRNLLIYFVPEVQRRAVSLFHFGLRVGGTLVLGPSETVRPWESEFDCVDMRWKIFRKLRQVRLTGSESIPMGAPALEPVSSRSNTVTSLFRPRGPGLFSKAAHAILSKHLGPSVLVNPQGELLHTFGDAHLFLNQPEGPATTDLLKMLEGDLRIAISTGLFRARQSKDPIHIGRIFHRLGDKELQLRVSVERFEAAGEQFTLVSFPESKTEAKPEDNDIQFEARVQGEKQHREMERELDLMRESLQTTIEELETSNEELQATNEELVASNEELQSTNEELQSVNEELHTVNSEHQRKIEELVQVYNDLDHLIKATGTAILYLDRNLRIRRFTDGIQLAFNVLEHDVGRPIEHISHNLVHPNVSRILAEANEANIDTEFAVQTNQGHTLLMRVVPYANDPSVSDGVLVTVTRGEAVSQVQEEARHATAQSERSDRELVEFAYAVSHDLQAGLRHLDQGVRELISTQASLNPVDKDGSVQLINRSASKLNAMIEGMLAYSRVHTRHREHVSTNLDRLVDGVIRQLSRRYPMEDVRFERESLPNVGVDPDQIETVFFHLLENAWKYRSDRPLVIGIKATLDGDHCTITVSDNGQGIEERNLARIFVIFQRNHHDSEVPGLGIGLSISRRIVERHGGMLTVESTMNEGSSFHFTLPGISENS